jgi:hypothetical protein
MVNGADDVLYVELKRRAQAEDRSISRIVRAALKAYVEGSRRKAR